MISKTLSSQIIKGTPQPPKKTLLGPDQKTLPVTGPHHIKMKEGAKPFALTAPRHVPVPLLPRVKAELDRMRQLGVIVSVREPTDWCLGMVVVPKPQDKVRICMDLT